MLLPVLVMSLLAADAEPTRIAATKFNVIGLGEGRGDFYTDHFADRLTDEGVSVMTPREISTLLGIERQKQLLGCTNETSACIAEIANALGVEGIVIGDIAKVGDAFQVNLKIIAASNGKRLAAHSALVKTEVEVLEELTYGANVMAISLANALGKTPPPKIEHKKVTAAAPAEVTAKPGEASSGTKRLWWIPAVVGGVAAGVGAYGLVTAADNKSRLERDAMDAPTADQLLASGKNMRTLGYVGLAVGAAGFATAVSLYLFGSDATVAPSAVLTPDGASIGLTGALP